jgi:hypothetical protein
LTTTDQAWNEHKGSKLKTIGSGAIVESLGSSRIISISLSGIALAACAAAAALGLGRRTGHAQAPASRQV